MKKILFFGVALITLIACSFNKELEPTKNPGANAQIGFSVAQKNMTKASLQDANHYNFGVFAYKSTDQVNWVMDNYLVGYFDDAKAYQSTGSTVEDKPGVENGKSYWMYEGMGKSEYNGTYAGGPLGRFFQSNKAHQYLKYWDLSAPSTTFYAYAPYVGTDTNPVTYVDGVAQTATGNDTYTLNIPRGTIEAGMNKPEEHEFMYAATKVDKANYGHDVSLSFKRLVAKVNIKFWEDVPGYKVRIIRLGDAGDIYGVAATPSIKDNITGNYGYKLGKYYTSNGVKISFADINAPELSWQTGVDTQAPLNFAVPTASVIGENRYAAAASADTYYALPKHSTNDTELNNTGFTFHVSYELTAEDSGEHIIVKDATVHVPAEYCTWEMNKHYTYIFKITKGSNGTTDDDIDPKPTDPEVPTVQSLYPIIFDNCTVTDWDEVETEWNITDGTKLSYHNVTLNTYSVNNSTSQTITVTIADGDTHNSHSVDYNAVTITGPNGSTTSPTGITYDSSNQKITVAPEAAAGLYTVTYTCPETDVNGNHPQKWNAYFIVGNAYTVSTNHDVIGCNGTKASAKLNVTAQKDNSGYPLGENELYIDYPANFKDEQKGNVYVAGTSVVVNKEATPGVYKLVLKINEGVAVKVAEHTFTVKDYSFDINPKVVYNNGSSTVIVCSQPASSDNVYTSTLGTVTDDNKITVPNGSTEGTYTITYSTWNTGSDEATVTYTQTFEVRNTHSVTLDKNSIDRNQGTSVPGGTSTDKITITAKINGRIPASDFVSSLSVVTRDGSGNETATTTGHFTITADTSDNSKYTLNCINTVTPGTYYVKFVSTVANAQKAEYAQFTVVE
ncbi:MAG: hypothetical protein PUC61_05695 [Bacteroidales bacterium]|nr:hypothetical protein [Bacteroidales bacterium]